MEPAINFIPEWYRTSISQRKGSKTFLDKNSEITSTYKKCMPFLDAMTSGYIIATLADIEVQKNEFGQTSFNWLSKHTLVTPHAKWQVEGMPTPDGYFPTPFKFVNEFTIKTPKGVSTLFINPLNRYDLPFTSINGIVDTDNYVMGINFPFLIKDDFTGIIKKGTPIIQLIPFERKNWKRLYKNFNKFEHKKNSDEFYSIIKRAYKTLYWVKKEYK
jgi:hypothetical protein